MTSQRGWRRFPPKWPAELKATRGRTAASHAGSVEVTPVPWCPRRSRSAWRNSGRSAYATRIARSVYQVASPVRIAIALGAPGSPNRSTTEPVFDCHELEFA